MRRLLAIVAACAVSAACGSTVQQAGVDGLAAGVAQPGVTGELGAPTADGFGTAPSGDGTTAPGAGAFGGTGSGSGASTGSAGGGSTPAGSTAGSVGAGGGAASPGTSSASGPVGPGITDTTIKYGIVAVDDPNAGNNAAGINTANVHRIDQTYEALINDLNKRGGINGRKVKLVVHRFENGTSSEQLQSQACEKFTKDDPVFLAPDLGESALTCFEKAGLAMVGGGHVGYGQSQYKRYPHLLSVGAFTLEHQVANNVRGFKAAGWMSGWNPTTGAPGSAPAHVGVAAFDIPVYREAIEKSMKPALAAAGVKEVDVFYIRPNLNDGQADAQAAVLQFKAEGVSHVTFLDNSGGLLEVVFTTNANSQGYFPRLGCDSGSCNQIVAETMPQSSLRGAALVGWSPLNDVPASKDHVLPERKRCEKVMVDAGMEPYSRNDMNVMANVCEGVWFFEEAARAAGRQLTADTLMAGAFAVGRGFASPATFATEITPSKHAGANGYRTASWNPTCGGGGSGCFIYSGPIRRFGS